MFKVLMVVNTLLTLPFAVGALAMPAKIFADFGVVLSPGGELVARGYASALAGYGLLTWFLRGIGESPLGLRVLIATGVFNAIELTVQFMAARQGLTNERIWLTVGAHAVMVLMTVVALVKNRR